RRTSRRGLLRSRVDLPGRPRPIPTLGPRVGVGNRCLVRERPRVRRPRFERRKGGGALSRRSQGRAALGVGAASRARRGAGGFGRSSGRYRKSGAFWIPAAVSQSEFGYLPIAVQQLAPCQVICDVALLSFL